jgi:plastin-1
MNITKTLSSLSKTGQGRPISDTEMLRWSNTTAQKGKPGVKPIRSFKDPSITTGLFFLDVLEGIKPGIVDPSLVYNVNEHGDYEERRQNGKRSSSLTMCRAMLIISCFACSETSHLDREKNERSYFPRARGYC